jgi:hypothetical protein
MPNYYPVEFSVSTANSFFVSVGLEHVSVQLVQRILFFFLIVIFGSWFSYLLIYYLTKNPVASLVGSIIYNFNIPFLVQTATGHMLLSIAYTFFPLAIYFFMLLLEKQELKNAIFLALSLFVCGIYEFRATYVLLWILFLYFAFHLFIRKKITLRESTIVGISILIFLLLNSFWLIGTLSNYEQYIGTAVGRSIFKGPPTDNLILSSFSLYQLFWSGGKVISFLIHPIPTYLFIIPILVFFTLIVSKENMPYKDKILFFSLLSLIGIFLSKFYFSPFPNSYEWMYNHFPGFNAFREPSKFTVIIFLSYSILISYLIDITSRTIVKKKIGRCVYYVLISLVLILFLWNTKPIITGEIGTTFIPREIPQDYLTFKPFILNQSDYFRTLYVPRDSRWGIYTNNNPKIGAVTIEGDLWKDFVVKSAKENYIVSPLTKNYSNALLDSSSIKYVVVPIRDTKNDDDFFVYYGNDSQYFINVLDNQTYLERVDIGTEELVIYENKNYLPHIYISTVNQSLENFSRESISEVNFTAINPSEYKVTFRNNKPFYLYFSEAYNQKWMIAQNFNWIKGLSKSQFITAEHTKSYGFLNAWYVDPSKLETNKDGEYELTIYFQPQSYFYLGLIISIITFLACIGYLVYNWRKSKARKHSRKSSAPSASARKGLFNKPSFKKPLFRLLITALIILSLFFFILIFKYYSSVPVSQSYSFNSSNLVADASFEMFNKTAGDCCNSNPNASRVYASKSTDAFSGNYSLLLQSSSQCSCASFPVANFSKSYLYYSSFYYKGDNPSMCAWIGGEKRCNPKKDYARSVKWQNYQFILEPTSNATAISMFFYAKSDGKKNVSDWYDNLEVIRLVPIDQIQENASYVVKVFDSTKLAGIPLGNDYYLISGSLVKAFPIYLFILLVFSSASLAYLLLRKK